MPRCFIRVYVDTPQQFDAWVKNQQRPGVDESKSPPAVRFLRPQACMNCHTIVGTPANGTSVPISRT